MSNGLLSEIILQRDGTSQSQRQASALQPDFIPVEERTLEDWLTFAQQFAAELTFFDNDNNPNGTWESFLTDAAITNKQFVADLLAYVQNPDTFSGDTEKLRKLSRPHLVLFVSFLQLLGYIKEQLNGFTKKHLDFFYFDILGLTPKGPVPDVANVIIQLADDVQELFVAKGTGLLAGKDSLDKDLVYITEKDTVISQATIKKIKTLYTGKQATTLHQLLQDESIKVDSERMLKMMQLVLGYPMPGDPLPYYNNAPVTLDILNALVNDERATDYITGKLFLTKEEFADLVPNYASNWSKTETTLINAYRRKELKKVRQQETDAKAGFLKMFLFALGNPQPGDALPPYGNKSADLDAIFNDLNNNVTAKEAEAYIKDYLYLTRESFTNSIIVRNNAKATDAAWLTVYADVAVAQQKKRTNLLADPFQVQWLNGYATTDALASAIASGNSGDTTLSFNTFGKGHSPKELSGAKPASIGFAIASPQLLMQEGKRTVTATLVFQDNSLAAIPDDNSNLFSFFLSTGTGWYNAAAAIFSYGNVSRDTNGNAVSNGDNVRFTPTTTGINAVQVQLTLAETDPPVVPPVAPDDIVSVHSNYPVLAAILNQSDAALSNYRWFKDAILQQVAVQVKVEGLKALTLQNDDAVLNSKKPFEPFGSNPEVGSHFYFAHSEVSSKPLNTLALRFEWMNKPPDLGQYYKDYGNIDAGKPITNASFKAALKYNDDTTVVAIPPPVRLFDDDASSVIHIEQRNIPQLVQRSVNTEEEETIAWKRFFLLELNTPDFQHAAYPALAARKAYLNAGAIANANALPANEPQRGDKINQAYAAATPLNPPYTPKLKSFSIDYTASFTIALKADATNGANSFFHITAFGYEEMSNPQPLSDVTAKAASVAVPLLPQFQNDGLVYVGIDKLFAPQNLSLFFQMAEGSANPDLEKPAVSWSYLSSGNNWQPLQGTNLIFDSTNGLLNTGIIEFAIPGDATNRNTAMGENLYWLQAGVSGNSDAIPDTVAVFTQAVSTRFVDNENAPEHFLTPLPPGSIQETAITIPEIDKILQPFSSLKGKPAEADEQFYIRVSERLRHKGRALTMWDYEYLVLEQFPEIYKVKCVPTNGAGIIEVIVIPDIKGKLPFNPFQPKAPSNLLYTIQQYLEQRISTWAIVKVKNPTYTQVKVRIAVKIKDGYSENYFLAKLEEDLIKYLAPWAYDTAAEIFLDRRIDADVIVNFVAEQFYIDYASDVYLFTSTNGKEFTSINLVDRENYVQATNPGEILVSAPGHIIDVIRKDYVANNYRGIGYMKVQLDFKIG